MELVVYNKNGNKTTRKVDLADDIFNVEPNDHLIYLDAKRVMAHRRQGTHSTKERSALSGSRRKLKRQKGTGTARQGDIKSPLLRGGARAFGPHPHKYTVKLSRKMKDIARKSALTHMLRDEKIVALENLSFEKPHTKQFAEILDNLKLNQKKVIVVLAENDKNVWLSVRNIPMAEVMLARELNTYDILKAQQLVLTEDSIKAIEELFSKETVKTEE
ncbi:MAG: 50S ribosomal protein L4 [Bacteroidota bacterium]